MRHEFAVIGLGRFGSRLAVALTELGHYVLAVDFDEDIVQRMANQVTEAVIADPTNPAASNDLGLAQFDAVVLGMSQIETSVLLTLQLKEAGVAHLVARARNEPQRRILTKLGADEVVFPEEDTAERLAHRLLNPDVIDIFQLEGETDISVAELRVPDAWDGKTLEEVDVGRKFNIIVLAVREHQDRVVAAPGALYQLTAGDILIVIGDTARLDTLRDELD